MSAIEQPLDGGLTENQDASILKTPVIEVRNLHKHFGGIVALDGVDFEVMPGECMGLIGDNGAGKSTLIKVISGAISKDQGEILFDGKPIEHQSPAEARQAGIETVYQTLALAQTLDAPTNIYLGREELLPGFLGKLGFIDRKKMRAKSKKLLQSLNIELKSLQYPISGLSGGQRQGVAIARATAWQQRLLILDEPTAALGYQQTTIVMGLIKRLLKERKNSISIIIITHDLPHIFEVADRVTILRQGKRVGVVNIKDATMEKLVSIMMGVSV